MLIDSSVLNAAGFLLVLCEGAIWLGNGLSECRKTDDLTSATPGESTALQTGEQITSSGPPEQIADNALRTNWDTKALGLLGGALVTWAGFLDPVATLSTNFSGTPSDNSTQTENSAGFFMLVTACATSVLGLGALVTAYAIEKYRSTSTDSDAINNPSPVESPNNSEEESAGLFSGWPAASDLSQLAMQAGYPHVF